MAIHRIIAEKLYLLFIIPNDSFFASDAGYKTVLLFRFSFLFGDFWFLWWPRLKRTPLFTDHEAAFIDLFAAETGFVVAAIEYLLQEQLFSWRRGFPVFVERIKNTPALR